MILNQFWWVAIPGLLLGLYAQFKLQSVYKRYRAMAASSGMTGAQAARLILDQAGLTGMQIHETPGQLSDHYDPRKKALFLSHDIYHGRSIASVGVAAHEAGHALQHKAAYAPLHWRMAMVPITQFASGAYLPIFLIGLFTGMMKLALPIIIGVFIVISLFQLVTLPVEFDASARAKQELQRLGVIQGPDGAGVSKMLNAAALTYVAALITSLLTLLQYVLMFMQGQDD